MARLAVVVEDVRAAPNLCRDLSRGGHECYVLRLLAHDDRELLRAEPQLVIVDCETPLGLGSWYEVLCERAKVPVFTLVPAADEALVVRALRAGADGCLVKPYNPESLLAHVDACLRRCWEWGAASRGNLPEPVMDPCSHTVEIKGREVRLSAAEFRLLDCLVRNRGRVVSREDLSSHIWGGKAPQLSDTSLNLCVYNLRSKIEDHPGQPEHILTRWGIGYYWADE